MKVCRELSDLKHLQRPVFWAMGVFDGLHLGHREVIRAAIDGAVPDSYSAVLTFRNHPLTLLNPEKAPEIILQREEDKLALLERWGLDCVLELDFADVVGLSPKAFIAKLCSSCRVKGISVGEDWHFGNNRSGDVPSLRFFGEENHFRVITTPPVLFEGERISSTRIRDCVRQADFVSAERMLGAPWHWFGTVIHGRRLGRTLQYPTANLKPGVGVIPPLGVYAVKALVEEQTFLGVANFGKRPTLEEADGELLLETHLFGSPGNLYGKQMLVQPIRFLREERKFSDLEALKTQLNLDAEAARLVFASIQ